MSKRDLIERGDCVDPMLARADDLEALYDRKEFKEPWEWCQAEAAVLRTQAARIRALPAHQPSPVDAAALTAARAEEREPYCACDICHPAPAPPCVCGRPKRQDFDGVWLVCDEYPDCDGGAK